MAEGRLPATAWPPRWPEDRRFRRLLAAHLLFATLLAALLALLPVSRPPPPERPSPPPVRLSLAPPPSAPAPAARPSAPPRPAKRAPSRPARPVQAPPPARERVRGRGLLAEAEQLARLERSEAARALAESHARRLSAPRPDAPREALARAAAARAGPVEAARAADPGHAPRLAGREITRVEAPEDPLAGAPAPPPGRPGRTQEEIQLVFERHKGAFDRLYSRALRRNPALGGRVTFEFAIAPSGKVLRARILSSDLGDRELERRLLTKLKTLDFGAKDVETTVVTYWIDFLG